MKTELHDSKKETKWAIERLHKIGKRAQKARKNCRGIRLSFEEIVLLDCYANLSSFGEITEDDAREIVDLA